MANEIFLDTSGFFACEPQIVLKATFGQHADQTLFTITPGRIRTCDPRFHPTTSFLAAWERSWAGLSLHHAFLGLGGDRTVSAQALDRNGRPTPAQDCHDRTFGLMQF
jgi:hypothetical protein